MTNKQRITRLEKQKVNSNNPLASWRAFIEWCRGERTLDADTEARIQSEWAEFTLQLTADEQQS